MPKVVDHEHRRLELISATWRIIAERGLEGTTMRQIADEAGFAHGALKPYFADKDDLLTQAFQHVFAQTDARIARATRTLRGLPALRALCHEVLPLDEERLSEARIVIPFWQRAVVDPAKTALHESVQSRWRRQIIGHLAQARQDGTMAEAVDIDEAAGMIMTFLFGSQLAGVLSPAFHSPHQLTSQFDACLAPLRPHRAEGSPGHADPA